MKRKSSRGQTALSKSTVPFHSIPTSVNKILAGLVAPCMYVFLRA